MITVTEAAQQKFLHILDAQEQTGWPIRLRILGRGVDNFAYDLASAPPDARRENDQVVTVDELTFLIDADSALLLKGATLDFDGERNGFSFHNPNPVWEDDLGPRVAQVILEQVNPSIAGHGGAVLPVAVRDGVVYVRMLGGCQGCGLANTTLTHGVARAIQDALPEIHDVVDVTHHAAGENPYYAAEQEPTA